MRIEVYTEPEPQDVAIRLKLEQDGDVVDVMIVDEYGDPVAAGFVGSFVLGDSGKLVFNPAAYSNVGLVERDPATNAIRVVSP